MLYSEIDILITWYFPNPTYCLIFNILFMSPIFVERINFINFKLQ